MRSKSLYVYELNWMTEASTPRERVLQLLEDALSDRMLAQVDETVLVDKLMQLALREDSIVAMSAIKGLVQLEAWEPLRQLVRIWIDPDRELKLRLTSKAWRANVWYSEASHLRAAYQRDPFTALLSLEINLVAALKHADTDEMWPAVRNYFRRKDETVRARAIEMAGRLRIRAAVNTLKRIIADAEKSSLHTEAIEALGEIGDARAMRYLSALLKDAPHRRDAIWALGLAKSPKAIPVLKKLWATSPSLTICDAIIEALGNIGGDKAARVLLQHLDGPHTNDVIEALGATGSEVAVPRLRKLQRSRSASQTTRNLAAEVLSQIDPASFIP
jgi:HEAT repeat protein